MKPLFKPLSYSYCCAGTCGLISGAKSPPSYKDGLTKPLAALDELLCGIIKR